MRVPKLFFFNTKVWFFDFLLATGTEGYNYFSDFFILILRECTIHMDSRECNTHMDSAEYDITSEEVCDKRAAYDSHWSSFQVYSE